jgi:hypothetical protein
MDVMRIKMMKLNEKRKVEMANINTNSYKLKIVYHPPDFQLYSVQSVLVEWIFEICEIRVLRVNTPRRDSS